MRVRLAEVYIRLGKKNDAWQIFSAAAETLRAKGSLSAAEEVLQRMLTLDPGNSYALLMQGRNLLQAGDAEAAIEALQKVSDLDSNPMACAICSRLISRTAACPTPAVWPVNS